MENNVNVVQVFDELIRGIQRAWLIIGIFTGNPNREAPGIGRLITHTTDFDLRRSAVHANRCAL